MVWNHKIKWKSNEGKTKANDKPACTSLIFYLTFSIVCIPEAVAAVAEHTEGESAKKEYLKQIVQNNEHHLEWMKCTEQCEAHSKIRYNIQCAHYSFNLFISLFKGQFVVNFPTLYLAWIRKRCIEAKWREKNTSAPNKNDSSGKTLRRKTVLRMCDSSFIFFCFCTLIGTRWINSRLVFGIATHAKPKIFPSLMDLESIKFSIERKQTKKNCWRVTRKNRIFPILLIVLFLWIE